MRDAELLSIFKGSKNKIETKVIRLFIIIVIHASSSYAEQISAQLEDKVDMKNAVIEPTDLTMAVIKEVSANWSGLRTSQITHNLL